MKKRGDPKVLPEGTIRIRCNGTQVIKKDGKWVHIKKPREEWNMPIAKPKEVWVNNYPPVTLPDHIKPTNYPYYYVSNDGIAYREPRRCDKNGRYGEINEWGLIQLTTQLRGNPNYGPEFMYESVNIYFYDEDGKNIGYKKRNIHQLVAETWIPNPHGYTEVLHGNKGNRCNDYRNLRWGTHKENMQEAESSSPEGTIVNRGGSLYEKKDGEWVLIPSNKPRGSWNKGKKFKMPEGYQVWNKGKKYSLPSQQLPEGTLKTRASGATFKKVDGKWVYQKKSNVECEFK